MANEDPRVVAGMARVRAALDHVQQAQVELSRAIADLSAVIGFIPEGDKLSKLYDQTRKVWYAIQDRMLTGPSKRYPEINMLDRTPDARDADPHERGCGYRGWKANFYAPMPFLKKASDGE